MLLFIDGFDHYNSNAQMLAKGYSDAAIQAIDTFRSRWDDGGYGCYMTTSGTQQFKYMLPQNLTTLYFGIAINKYSAGGSDHTSYPLIRIQDEAEADQIKILMSANRALRVYGSGTNWLGDSADFVHPDTNIWFYLEGKITISDTVGEVLLKINEQMVVNLTGIDTKWGTDYIRYIGFQCHYNHLDTNFDDFYLDDSQFHGNCRVRTFMPDADSGTHTDFVRSGGANDYECVDEIPANDDTDYIAASALNAKSAFGITTGAVGVIKALQLNNRVKATTSGVRRIKALCRSGGADYKKPVSGVISTSYLTKNNIWQTDPDDAQPWNQTKLEAAEFGVELVGGSTTTSTTTTTTTTTTTA